MLNPFKAKKKNCAKISNELVPLFLIRLQAAVKASLNLGTGKDEKLQQTMSLTLKRLNTYQQVRLKTYCGWEKVFQINLKGQGC